MKALIVDDDLALADVVAFTMRRAGYDAILAPAGAGQPPRPRALTARAGPVLRRARPPPLSPAPLTAGDLTLDPARGVVQRGADAPAAQLTRQECRLLEILMLNR